MTYPDIFFTPEYAKVFEKTGFGGEWVTLNSNTDIGSVVYNYYVRSIPNTEYFDIISPYGYSGILNANPDYLKSFHDHCLHNKIVSEFCRLHPFIENHKQLPQENVVKNGIVYYIDLTKPFKYEYSVEKHIHKAIRNGIEVRNTDVKEFADLYYQTMQRNKAISEYYFTLETLEELCNLKGSQLLTAWYKGKIVSGRIIISSTDYAHDFLAGSTLEGNYLCAGHLLLDEAIRWSKNKGCKIFNLGGAKTETHGSFKWSFSHMTKPFYTYRKVHNQRVYDELSKGIQTDYFPAYRNDRHTTLGSYENNV